MKRAIVFFLSAVLVITLFACGSNNPANTASARAVYDVFQGPDFAPAKRMKKQKQAKKLKYSNGRGGTTSSKPNTKKKVSS